LTSFLLLLLLHGTSPCHWGGGGSLALLKWRGFSAVYRCW
jgi:hypothetical protein